LKPPWKRTASSFPNRFTVNRCDPRKDSQEARDDHKKLIQTYRENSNILYIYTDGSKLKRANFFRVGAASVAYNGNTEVAHGLIGLGGHAEVYDAEMAALAIGATQAADFLHTNPQISHIAFFSDNSAATLAIADPSPQAAQLFAAKFHNTLRPLLEANPNLSVSISWCPSHCGIKGNERADVLAKEATQRERETPYSVTRANATRRSKNSMLKLWRLQWKNQPRNGRYAVANQFPPSLKPTPHFQQLKDNRELFGRLIQCRTGHSYTGEFRQTFLPHSEDPTNCPCDNETLQSREHILRECTRYSQHRKILRKISPTISLQTVLGTKDGIQALITFLKKSGAFTRTGTTKQPYTAPTFEDEPEVDSDLESLYDPNGD